MGEHVEGESADAGGRFELIAEELDRYLEVPPRTERDDRDAEPFHLELVGRDHGLGGVDRRPLAPAGHVVADGAPVLRGQGLVVRLGQTELFALFEGQLVKSLGGVPDVDVDVVQDVLDERLELGVVDLVGELPGHVGLSRGELAGDAEDLLGGADLVEDQGLGVDPRAGAHPDP